MNKPDIKKQVEDALQRAKDAGYVSSSGKK